MTDLCKSCVLYYRPPGSEEKECGFMPHGTPRDEWPGEFDDLDDCTSCDEYEEDEVVD